MKDLVATVPILGQSQKPQGPIALFRVRSAEAVYYCGYSPLDACRQYYELEPDGTFHSLLVEACPVTAALEGNPQWEQLLPKPASSESVIVASE